MDIKEFQKIIDKNVIYSFVALVMVLGFGYGYFIIPQIDQINQKKQQLVSLQTNVQTLQQQLAAATQAAAPQPQAAESGDKAPVEVYVSPYAGVDVETAAVDLVDQLVQIIRTTKNKVVEVSFTSSPPEASQASVATGVLTLNITLTGSYVSLQNLLNTVYSWKYLSQLKDFTISPASPDDPENLNAKFTIDLYVKTS